jgi:hypothetical protein
VAAFFDGIMSDFASGKELAPSFLAEVVSAEFAFAYLPYLGSTGVSSAPLAPLLTLPRNTLVQRFDLVVGAGRATRTPAQAAGQVRAYDNAGVHTVIIDFGVPRTVSSVSVASGASMGILSVSAWIGAKFDDPFIGPLTGSPSPRSAARFPSEVRTERLLIGIDRAANATTIGADLELELPELPTDLEIRINGGAPVWTHPGPAQANNSATLVFDSFNKDGQRLVALADALNALLADPLNADLVTLDIVLAAKVPGVLSLSEQARDLRLIKRMAFNGDTSSTLAFAAEGRLPLGLELPELAADLQRRINEVRFTALATPAPERVLPPEGPPAARMPDGQVLAELLLDADHAAAVRLPGEPQLAELTGVRLPLEFGGDGAEARVVLWSNLQGGPGADEPGSALPGGASDPVTLSGGGSGEAWVTFSFKKPVLLDAGNPPWAVVLVARGQVTWALARRADAAGCELRRGAPNGPWRPLPAPFAGPVLDACGRIRRMGHAPKAQPLPPWQVSLAGEAAAVPVLATPKGAVVPLRPSDGAASALSLLAYGAGSLTLRDIDVIWTERPTVVTG